MRDAYRDVFPSRESDALTVVTPVLEARLKKMRANEELAQVNGQHILDLDGHGGT